MCSSVYMAFAIRTNPQYITKWFIFLFGYAKRWIGPGTQRQTDTLSLCSLMKRTVVGRAIPKLADCRNHVNPPKISARGLCDSINFMYEWNVRGHFNYRNSIQFSPSLLLLLLPHFTFKLIRTSTSLLLFHYTYSARPHTSSLIFSPLSAHIFRLSDRCVVIRP